MALREADNRSIGFRAADAGQDLWRALMRDRVVCKKQELKEKDALEERTNDLAQLIKRQKWLPFICSAIAGGSKLLLVSSMADNFDRAFFGALGDRVAPDFKEGATHHMEGKKTQASGLVERIKAEREEQAQAAAKADNASSRLLEELSSLLGFMGRFRVS